MKIQFSIFVITFSLGAGKVISATTVVDWLEFRALEVGGERTLIGSDSGGRDIVTVSFMTVSGTFVPGSPSAGEIPADSWNAEFPYEEIDGSGGKMTTFQTQATAFGGQVNYAMKVTVMRTPLSVVLGVGNLFASDDGRTQAVDIAVRDSSLQDLAIPNPAVQVASDNGVARNSLPLTWDGSNQSLSVAGLDSQARNSEFAFFDLEGAAVSEVEFQIPNAYERGSGDILEFSVGITVPEPGGCLLLALGAVFFTFRRRGD